ncbi:MAG TPA: hypothetical protein PLF50_06070 [Candidatus Cloacimonadota bacterium]|nr:hypothetical protein [Candidatus Cloacimonadota bacterium]
MSLYSAFYDSVRQKKDLLKTTDRTGTLKDFRACLKLDYLIYGSILFTDAQIFDGAMFHEMANDDYYWDDFVSFIKKSEHGSIIIRHGMNNLSDRIDSCLSNPTFELSSLDLYDNETIEEVKDTRSEAIKNNLLKSSSKNLYYRNMSRIKSFLLNNDLVDKGIFSSWINDTYNRNMLSLFRDKPYYYDSFLETLKRFRDYSELNEVIDLVAEQFDVNTGSIPRRSDWKLMLDMIINKTSNNELKDAANDLLLYLNDCYVCLCAHQHRCDFASLESPFSFSKDRHKLSIEDDYHSDVMSIGLNNKLWNNFREENFDKFLERLHYENIRNIKKEWLASLYSEGRNFDINLLLKLMREIFTQYYKDINITSFSEFQADIYQNGIDTFLGLCLGRKVIKPLKDCYSEIKNNAIILNIDKFTGVIANDISAQITTQYDNKI